MLCFETKNKKYKVLCHSNGSIDYAKKAVESYKVNFKLQR